MNQRRRIKSLFVFLKYNPLLSFHMKTHSTSNFLLMNHPLLLLPRVLLLRILSPTSQSTTTPILPVDPITSIPVAPPGFMSFFTYSYFFAFSSLLSYYLSSSFFLSQILFYTCFFSLYRFF